MYFDKTPQPDGSSSLWAHEWSELAKFCGAMKLTRSARLLAGRRRSTARSTAPLRLRRTRVSSPVWPVQSDSPSLISLYAELVRTTDGLVASPQ